VGESVGWRALQRAGVLVLLEERESHGYELLSRLDELLVGSPDSGALYRELRAMEAEGLLRSAWHKPAGDRPSVSMASHPGARRCCAGRWGS